MPGTLDHDRNVVSGFRFVLERDIDTLAMYPAHAVFVMLNPSTADHAVDDPTIRRCVRFAAEHGSTRLTVVNLFAQRATDPKDLSRALIEESRDRNVRAIDAVLSGFNPNEDTLVAAWGASGFAGRLREASASMVKTLEMVARRHSAPIHCLGTTKAGHPRHPLYVPASQRIVPWSSP